MNELRRRRDREGQGEPFITFPVIDSLESDDIIDVVKLFPNS